MDLTPIVSAILVEQHSTAALSAASAQLSRRLDTFVQDAYGINDSITSLLSYLRAIRQPYLSTAPPPRRATGRQTASTTQYVKDFGEIPTHLTDPQREQIDQMTSQVLSEINAGITTLTTQINAGHDLETALLDKQYGKSTSVFSRWAAGDVQGGDAGKSDGQLEAEGRLKTLKQCRDGIIWYLTYSLGTVVSLQQNMVEIRIERERDKGLSVLYDPRNRTVERSPNFEDDLATFHNRATDSYDPALDPAGRRDTMDAVQMPDLTQEQLQLFEQENSSLLNHYTDQLAKVTEAEKSLMEIGQLQSTLMGHLNVQGDMIGNLVNDAESTTENVKRGNKELKKASERNSTARMVFFGTVSLCGFLVVWDLIF